ncbi:amidase [Patulibacter minatonensis]|uniref:amidase n=1 Tax=Patulibacter minatonensis TaxID=298163 RepID=UPI00068677B6|nr:amidase [Patulibacter minatonensis]
MRESSAPADAVVDAVVDALDAPSSDVATSSVAAASSVAPSGTDAPAGLSRRRFVGKAGIAGAGVAVLSSGVLASTAATAAAKDVAPGTDVLPTVASVKARLETVRLVDLDTVEQAALLQAREITSVALTQAYLDRIDKFNGPFEDYTPGGNGYLNAFVRIARDEALKAAAAADARLDAGHGGGAPAPFLCGIPMGVKDSIGLKDRPAQNGTVAFKGNVGVEDGPAMAKLRAAGVVFLGHTICSAFSGATTGNFAGNAWNAKYIPGGSSQGSGVAPVARLASACIGEETGGSIMFPSACNGASGIKPSLGLVSVAGVMPLRVAVDVIGPISRSMRDSALILNTIMGPDAENDPQTLSAPIPRETIPMTPKGGTKPLTGLTIGIPQTDWMGVVGTPPQQRYDADYLTMFTRLRGQLETLGATVIEFPGLDLTLAANNTYQNSTDTLETVDGSAITPLFAASYPDLYDVGFADSLEAFANQFPANRAALLANYGRRAGGATANTVPAVAPTFTALAAVHGGVSAGARREGNRRRRQMAANYQKALDDAGVDFMLVMSVGAKIGLRPNGGFSRSRTYFQTPNILGWPMVSFPIGFGTDAEPLPISAQFWGTRFSEPQIVQAALDYQAAFPEYHRAIPPEPAAVPVAARRTTTPPSATFEIEEVDPLFSNDPVVYASAVPDELRPR